MAVPLLLGAAAGFGASKLKSMSKGAQPMAPMNISASEEDQVGETEAQKRAKLRGRAALIAGGGGTTFNPLSANSATGRRKLFGN